MKLKKILASVCLAAVCILPMGVTSQAAFNSWLAYSPNYRPLFADKVYEGTIEYYVDLTSIHTTKNTDTYWEYNVIEFSSLNDSGKISKQWVAKYRVNKKDKTAFRWDSQKNQWIEIPMIGRIPRGYSVLFASVNYSYAYMFGTYLSSPDKMQGYERMYKG